MRFPILNKVKIVWDSCNIQGFIILSLFLQTCLVLFAPLRKRTTSRWMIIFIWSAYSAADWAANFIVGLITNSVLESSGLDEKDDLLAFWAPFLLLHLGGQDTITAFALEDNELWMRCCQRAQALYLGSLENFRESLLAEPFTGPTYAEILDDIRSKVMSNAPDAWVWPVWAKSTPQELEDVHNAKEGKLTDLEIVGYASRFFYSFRALVVDQILGFEEREESRGFFLKRRAKDAFKIVETELNFFYQALYTKMRVLNSTAGYIWRFLSFTAVFTSLIIVFFFIEEVKTFSKLDIAVTYIMLVGAVLLDIISFTMLLFTDWSIAKLRDQSTLKFIVLKRLFDLKRKLVKRQPEEPTNTNHRSVYNLGFPCRILFRRWSGSVPSFNLIEYSRHQRSKTVDKIISMCGVGDIYDSIVFVSRQAFNENLRDFIFEEMKRKSRLMDTLKSAKALSLGRGDWVLKDGGWDSLLTYIVDIDFDDSLLLWHIATELCYNSDDVDVDNDEEEYRQYAKLLSDYMIYLLVMKPVFISAVAGIAKSRFRDTCAETKRFFLKYGKARTQVDHKFACSLILSVDVDIKPINLKGDGSKSVLFDACILAKEINQPCYRNRWEIMCKVWVEMMFYAAIRCRALSHVQQLSKGGELLTLIWILMAHFGFGQQFQRENYPKQKLGE
ncbi:uncharacterized protein LOC141661728 isoform X1 [Apium graveolens]|uniref:uncharacterized protein LOC141661728 isoform X1 n=1 Tax=Apium graveolens TaxID=4045 RepID=UPI003D794FF9